jgi:DNA-binding response OmpR family regulator
MTEAPESKIPETILSRYLHAVPLLRLDARGDVWLDGKRQDIRLTKLPHCLLELLWTQRHRYVSEDEVHSHLYPDAGPEQQRGKDALYKLVQRLRNQLEPDRSNSKNYVDYVHGRGYRLCNFEDDVTS